MLQEFFENIADFKILMKTHQVVVSGSLVLQLLLPRDRISWPVTDMDIYVPCGTGQHIANYLNIKGYSNITETLPPHTRYQFSQSHIHNVMTFTRLQRTIDVIVSISSNPLLPIFCFHSTTVMNYFNADIFFSAYPSLTTNFKALINPFRFESSKPTSVFKRCLDKYVACGFLFAFNPNAWDVASNKTVHECQEDYNCPHRMRTSVDNGCFRFNFGDSNGLHSDDMADDIGPPVTWMLGGHMCNSENMSHSFLSTLS
ncbi:hypothetical protein BJ138DRAFT_1019164 [Hygrophoropsis aurantiaca]|uniref:Uncharacterized protein n=1 Tax=Hygrophoropsis aurantiaca TaxID=72124 RepID=A0ACB7ZU92_9AGAM|nr:hypothetical protein BJ138DRAFT_1019164 [Hygrophoropsis aurantiaca]